MPHPLVLALFESADAAAAGARAVHALGVGHEHLSVVARDHEEEGRLARRMDGTPGADIEDSRPAARLGELGAHILAAMALVMPGIGPIVAGGPLAAGLGEAAGHVAGQAGGGLAAILSRAGVDETAAAGWDRAVGQGAVLLGVHAVDADAAMIRRALAESGARDVALAEWE